MSERARGILRDWKRKWEISGNLAPFHFPGASERKSERAREGERKKEKGREGGRVGGRAYARGDTSERAENLFLECLCDFVRIIITSEKGLRGGVSSRARYEHKIPMPCDPLVPFGGTPGHEFSRRGDCRAPSGARAST